MLISACPSSCCACSIFVPCSKAFVIAVFLKACTYTPLPPSLSNEISASRAYFFTIFQIVIRGKCRRNKVLRFFASIRKASPQDRRGAVRLLVGSFSTKFIFGFALLLRRKAEAFRLFWFDRASTV